MPEPEQAKAEQKQVDFTYPTLEEDRFISRLFSDIVKDNTREYRFWENNPTMYFSKQLNLSYDTNLYIKEDDRTVLNEINTFSDQIRHFSFKDLISEFVLPINNQNSNLFTKNEEGEFAMVSNSMITEKNTSLRLFNSYKQQFITKMNSLLAFYKLKSQIARSYDVNKFIESNLFTSFYSSMQEYISFKLVTLKNSRSLLAFNRNFEKFRVEVELFNQMAKEYLTHQKDINIFDYLQLLKKNFVKNEFLSIFVNRALNQSLVTVSSIIQSIGFKHASLKLLTANLSIEYTKDDDYNYKTKNIPKILKQLVEKILAINQNYLLLKNSCVDIYSKLLENSVQLFTEMNLEHFAKRYVDIRQELIRLRNTVMGEIMYKLVS